MANEFRLRLLSADTDFYEGMVVSLTLPTLDGKLGIMAGHSNMVAAVVPGIISYRLADDTLRVAVVSHGLVRVSKEDVLVLVDSIEQPERIDATRAKNAVEATKKRLLQELSPEEHDQAVADYERAVNRLRAAAKDE